MLINPPPVLRRRDSLPKRRAPRAVALSLLSATYDADAPGLFLTFDRAIDLAGIDVASFTVDDGVNGYHMIGSGAPEVVSPVQVLVYVVFVEAYSGPDVLMTATADNGIIALDDGGKWTGASGLVLPFTV
jgi:hypothetical protein